jgi:hypothetical protein
MSLPITVRKLLLLLLLLLRPLSRLRMHRAIPSFPYISSLRGDKHVDTFTTLVSLQNCTYYTDKQHSYTITQYQSVD